MSKQEDQNSTWKHQCKILVNEVKLELLEFDDRILNNAQETRFGNNKAVVSVPISRRTQASRTKRVAS